jgi:hypothetical protein
MLSSVKNGIGVLMYMCKLYSTLYNTCTSASFWMNTQQSAYDLNDKKKNCTFVVSGWWLRLLRTDDQGRYTDHRHLVFGQ